MKRERKRTVRYGLIPFLATAVELCAQDGPETLLVGKPPEAVPALSEPSAAVRPLLVAFGAASGGPHALSVVLGGLPRDLPAALLVVQQISPEYAAGLVSWLEQETGFPVVLAEPGVGLRAGTLLLVPAGEPLVLSAEGRFQRLPAGELPAEPASIDLCFGQLAETGPPGIAVLLSGLGRDGVEGLSRLRREGWLTVRVEERAVSGSGKRGETRAAESAELVLPLEAIAPTLAVAVSRRASPR